MDKDYGAVASVAPGEDQAAVKKQRHLRTTVEFEVAAMPAGGHPILDQTRQAILDRAQAVLKQLQAREDAAGDPLGKKVTALAEDSEVENSAL